MNDFKFLEIFGEIDDDIIYQAGQPLKRKKKFFHAGGYGVKVACAAVIIGILLGGIFHTEVRAAWEKLTTMISQMLGVKEDLTPYTEFKDLSVTKNGLKLTLKEVILEDDELLILFSQGDEDDGMPLKDIGLAGHVWIDGKELEFVETYLADVGLDKIAANFVLGYYIDDGIKVGKSSEIKVLVSASEIDEDGNITVLGEYGYDFTASKEKMEGSTESVRLSHVVKETGVIDMKLNKLTMNSVSSRIYGTCPDLILGRDYYLIGNDNLGNPVKYILRIYETPELVFVKDNGGNIDPNAKSMELQLFIHVIDGNVIESVDEEQGFYTDDAHYGEDVYDDNPAELKAVGDKITIVLE